MVIRTSQVIPEMREGNNPSFTLICHNIIHFMINDHSLSFLGVANGKFEALWDGETSVFLCEPGSFWIFRLRDQDRDSKTAFRKNWDCKTFRTTQKTRLWDPWNSTKILQDPYFLKTVCHPSFSSILACIFPTILFLCIILSLSCLLD